MLDLQLTVEELKYLEEVSKNKELQQIEYNMCAKDPYYWMTNWAFTLDTHDPTRPVKKFPDKEYIKTLVNVWLSEPLMLVPKSRQMMVSWIFTALYLWDTQFHFGRLSFFQSKKEEDADSLVKRSKFIYDYQPKFLKKYKINPSNQGQHIYCRFIIPEIQSEIRGIPQGGDQIRMHTASGLFADEMAFQPEAEDAYIAAKPTIDGGGRFTGVSSANPGFFEEMVFDRVEV